MMVDTKVPAIIFCAIIELEVEIWQESILSEQKKKSYPCRLLSFVFIRILTLAIHRTVEGSPGQFSLAAFLEPGYRWDMPVPPTPCPQYPQGCQGP